MPELSPQGRQRLITEIRAAINRHVPISVISAALVTPLPANVVDAGAVLSSRVSRTVAPCTPAPRVAWCGKCESDGYRWIQVVGEDGMQRMMPCPECSPQAAARAIARA